MTTGEPSPRKRHGGAHPGEHVRGAAHHRERLALAHRDAAQAEPICLGVRLDRLGYRVDVLDSTTYEEATHSLGNWLRQRSRWLKGWMQTWLVHMRSPLCTWREMGPAGFAVFQVLMGGMVVSALVHPFFLAAVLYGLAAGTLWPTTMSISQVLLFALQAVVLLVGYGVMMLIGRRACAIRQLTKFKASIPAMPIYWLLGSASGTSPRAASM